MSEKPKCLVSGATGFLGTNLVHALVAAGWEVRAFGLPGSETRYIRELPVEIVYGDICNEADVSRAVGGVEVVFHLAGDTSWWKRHFERQRRINVDGALNVARACLKHGVRRLVHTSTVDALGYDPQGPATETWPHYNYGGTGYNYADTKRAGERLLREFVGEGLELVVVYPGSMIGPYDFTLQYGRLFFDLRDGKVPGCPPGGVSFGHVAAVARAHIAAAEVGRSGEGYICAGVNVPYKDLFAAIAGCFGRPAPRLVFPRWAFVAYGLAGEAAATFSGQAPEVDPGMARYMSVNAYYDSSKAVRELGYEVVPLPTMIADAYEWYRRNGYF